MLADDNFPSHVLNLVWKTTSDIPQRLHQPLHQELGKDVRVTLLVVIVLAFLVNLLAVLVTFLFGSRKGRTVATLICVCTSVALWMWLLRQGDEIVYAGRVIRIQSSRQSIDEYLRTMDESWDHAVVLSNPTKSRGKWVYTHAYPIDRPSMLMSASRIAIPNTSLAWIAMERSAGSAIRMELAGENVGYWIELRSDDLPPQPFVGGLDERFTPKRWSKIGPKLYLVVLDRD
jgi:hypothetical protein